MLVGYERVSTDDQITDLQHNELVQAGCEKFFADKMSGKNADRPGLNEALNFLREGDVLVVWRLDRLGRSLKDLIQIVESLQQRNIGFKSLREVIDTTTPAGKLVFHLFGALAEFERDLIRERVNAGLSAARARGRKGGRKPKLTPQQIEIAKSLARDPDRTVTSICEILQVSRQTYYTHIAPLVKQETHERI